MSNPYWFGLYGAQLPSGQDRLQIGSFHIYRNPKAEWNWYRDKQLYKLTAVGYLHWGGGLVSNLYQQIADLSAAWTLVQHQDVMWGGLERLLETTPIEDVVDSFEETENLNRERRKPWPSPIDDHLFLEAIKKLVARLQCDDNEFRGCLYRAVESLRITRFVDVTYYMLFSGLEMLARARTGIMNGHVSEPIYKFLTDEDFGSPFNMMRETKNPLYRSVQSYCHLRNALFHNGNLSVEKRHNQQVIKYELHHYLLMLERLVPLVLVRDTGLTLDEKQKETWVSPADRNAPAEGWNVVE